MSGKFLVGTRFYRFPTKTDIPDIIRLKKQEGETLFFDDGGYYTTLTNEEFQNMLSTEDLVKVKGKRYCRTFDYFGSPIKQTWEMDPYSNPEDLFIRFKVCIVGVKMSIKELRKAYVRLTPDGFFTISNVDYPINNSKERGFDVLCTLNLSSNTEPYVVCRQDTVDVFKFTNDNKMIPIGLSVSRESCPRNMDFNVFLYSDNVYDFKTTAVYMEDSLKDVLKYVSPLTKYDATMKKLYDRYKNTAMTGCFDNVYDLLLKNGFYEDFKRAFGVWTYPFDIDLTRCNLNEQEENMLNAAIKLKNGRRMVNVVYCPFERGMDLKKYNDNYIIVNNGTDKITSPFVFSYEVR